MKQSWRKSVVYIFTKHEKTFTIMCTPNIIGFEKFVMFFGILGLVVTMLDLFHIIMAGDYLPDKIWPLHRYSTKRGVLCPKLERDFKLVITIISLEHYFLLVLGVYTVYPLFLIPWIFIKSFTILLHLVFFIVRLVIDRSVKVPKEILYSLIMLCNWIQVVCLFRQQVLRCGS